MTQVRTLPSGTITVTLRTGDEREVNMDQLLSHHYYGELAGSEWPEKFNRLRALNLAARKGSHA